MAEPVEDYISYLRNNARIYPQSSMVGYGAYQSDQFIKPDDVNQPWFPRTVQQDNQTWANMGVPIDQIPPEHRMALARQNPALAQRLGVQIPAPTVNLLQEQGHPVQRMRRLASRGPRRRPAVAPVMDVFLADQPPL